MKIDLSKTGVKGKVKVSLYDPEGAVRETRETHNVTTSDGFKVICENMGNPGASQPAFSYSAIGTNNGTPSTADTSLGFETARQQGNYTRTKSSQWKNVNTFGAGTGTGAIREAGLFNDTAAGSMLCRQTFAVINKGSNDTLAVTWQYTLSSA